MVTPIKVLLFLAGGSAAAGTTAYVAGVFDPYFNPPAAEAPAQAPKVAALPQTPAPQEKPAVRPSTTSPAEATAPEPEVQVPAFDLVRVQGDGSIVIAGNAAPQAKVEAVIGSRVIGSAVAGPDGDFAIAVDQPLKPGNYQIVLRSTAPGNVVATSTETAVVSVPEAPNGQVLALVEAPGKPSELITVPKPEQPKAEEPPAPAAAKPAAEQPAVTPPKQPAAASAEPPAATPAAPADKPAAAEDKPATTGEQVAAAPKPAPAQPPAEKAAGEPRVAVEAVEIEGRRIFIAGSADPGRLLRAYANETLLGQTTASPTGRFLVEAERDLPVGDYIIRVDALEPNGAKVVARAAVPFEREAGENIAAVAPHVPRAEPAAPPSETKPDDKAAAAPGSPEQPSAPTGTVQPQAPAAAETKPAAGTAPEAPAAAPQAQPATEQPAVAAAPAGQPRQPESGQAPEAAAAAAPAETLAPKLQSVDGAVIIRRGDTLWRISRRVYGYGTRYSTIYLANQDQIRDPDLIWPGQVFSVPERSGQGEKADMSRLGAQAVPPTIRQ